MYDQRRHFHPERPDRSSEDEQPVKPPPSPPSAPLVVRKDEMEFHAFPEELVLEIWDYHSAPVHLSLEDLHQLGLSVSPERAATAASEVAPWRLALREGRRELPTPRLSDEASARALHVGGVAWLPVKEGVDLYVTSYHTASVRLGVAHLARLGLRHRSA